MQTTLTRPTSMNTLDLEKLTAAPANVIVAADAGTVLKAFDSTILLKLSGQQTQGQMALGLATVPPGGGPPPHFHHHEDELFLVVDGQFRFLTDTGWTEPMGAGSVFYSPRGMRHTFQNAGDTPGRFWSLSTPSGFEQFFAKCAGVFAQPGPPDMERIVEISAEHGIEYVAG